VNTGVWALAGVLLITIALIFSAREERRGFPSVTNTRASGYSAFAELLRRDGYKVRLERSVRPRFAKHEVVIALTRGGDEEFDESTITDLVEGAPVDVHAEQIVKHLENGGRAIEIVNTVHFDFASDETALAERFAVSPVDSNRRYSLSLPSSTSAYTAFDVYSAPYDAWDVGEYPYVEYMRHGDGLLVLVGEGLPATNRFLDAEKRQNAEFFLNLVRNVAPTGATIVFDESGIGNAEEPTVANTLGEWAVAARWQAGLLFVVLIYTFARRFGLPETEARAVRSSRELFDAIADVFRRTSNTGLALDNLLVECDQRIRRVLNVSSVAKRSDILQMAPTQLRDQYLLVSEHANANSSPRAATAVAAHLLKLLDEFEHDSRAVRGLKR
jgi:hypothetical protein